MRRLQEEEADLFGWRLLETEVDGDHFCAARVSQTDSGPVEDGGQHQHDVVGPVLLIHSHLVLLDHQDVQMRRSVHGVVEVKQTVLVTARGRGENWTLDAVWTLLWQRQQYLTIIDSTRRLKGVLLFGVCNFNV